GLPPAGRPRQRNEGLLSDAARDRLRFVVAGTTARWNKRMTATVENAVGDLQRANAEVQRQLVERTAERDEALERQTATAEILRVISSSPTDVQPTFDAIAAAAPLLTGATRGIVLRLDRPPIAFA